IIWDQSGFKFPDEGLVRLVDRPGAKISGEGPRRLSKFRCRRIQAEIGAGFEFGTVGAPVHHSISPTGIEDQDAFWIGTKVLPLGAVRGRGVGGDECPSSDELLFER